MTARLDAASAAVQAADQLFLGVILGVEDQTFLRELDLVNARRNLLDTMSQHVYQSDADGAGANTLKQHIDAIAASIPSTSPTTAPAAAGAAAPAPAAATASTPLLGSSENNRSRLGRIHTASGKSSDGVVGRSGRQA